MAFAAITAASVIAGVIQSVTGFGSAIFLMLVVPYFFDMVASSAIASSIAMGLGLTLAWQFRKHIQWKVCALPAVVYTACGVAAINVLKGIDLEFLSLMFGVFLVLLSVYFLVLAPGMSVKDNWITASVCSGISGVTSGLFGIGGPLMALYFVSASRDKESYIGNIQFLFGATNIINFATRISRGIYTMDLIPITILGFIGINIGKMLGLKILNRLNLDVVKKGVYGFVGISGVLTVVQQIF